MRALRVVGVLEGGDVVLEDPERRERFTVPADEKLRAAARGDLTRLGQIAIELESQLRPREIQARIRAGESVEQVATAAGVPLAKIERFAYPVLLERSRSAELGQLAHPVRADGPDPRTLGEVVAHTFGLRGQEYAEAEWDSWKGEDGRWVIALSWRAGRSENQAHWTFQPGANGGTVTALDEHAGDLVEGLPARPLRTVGPVIDMARPDEPAPEPAPTEELRAAASGSVRDRTPERHTAAEARPAPERQRAQVDPRRSVSRQAVEAPPVQPPPEEAPMAAEVPATEPEPTPEPEPPAATDTPETEPAAAAPPAEPSTEPAPPAGRRTKKGKPVMPSWDEVLLGVRGQR